MISDVFPTYSQFKAWLESGPGAKRLYKRGDDCHCPIATYIRLKGIPNARVANTEVLVHRGALVHTSKLAFRPCADEFDMPQWAVMFISIFDDIFDDQDDCCAAEALAALKAVYQEHSP